MAALGLVGMSSMRRTYRPGVFIGFCAGSLLAIVVAWFCLRDRLPEQSAGWATLIIVVACGLGVFAMQMRVTIDDEGIAQRVFRRRFVHWTDVVSWKRVSMLDSDGPDIITIETRSGPLVLSHNCVYGRRLDEVESELRNRAAPWITAKQKE
jgi:hypothetical protein